MKILFDQTKTVASLAFAALSLGLAIAPASADVNGLDESDDPSPWTAVASTCAVDDSSLNKYAFNNADFSFSGNQVSALGRLGFFSPITVRCNVDNPLDANTNPKWNTLIIGYSDPDLTATNASVSARLVQVKRATGTVSIVAKFDSNDFTSVGRVENYTTFEAPMDFHNNEYFVQLDLYRFSGDRGAPAEKSPIVYSARLVNASPVNIPK